MSQDQKTKEERDAILAELHQEDDDDDDDEDLDIAKMVAAKKTEDLPDPEVEDQKRLKENVMDSIYAQISDDDEEEEEKKPEKPGDDNPFDAELKREAVELQKREAEEKKKAEEQAQKQLEESKDAGARVTSVMKGLWEKASQAKEAVQGTNLDEVKGKLASAQANVSQSVTNMKGSEFFSKMKAGVGELAGKAAEKGGQVGQMLQKMQQEQEENQRMGLAQFLEKDSQPAEVAADTIAGQPVGHFIINDEDDEVLIEKLEAKAKEGAFTTDGGDEAEAGSKEHKETKEKPQEYHEDAEAFDDSSEEEDHIPAKPEVKEELKPEVPHPCDLFKKGNLVELEDVNPVMFIGGRKEVKNASLVRNFISSFEDRYLGLVNFKKEKEERDNFQLVVLKRWEAGANSQPPLYFQSKIAKIKEAMRAAQVSSTASTEPSTTETSGEEPKQAEKPPAMAPTPAALATDISNPYESNPYEQKAEEANPYASDLAERQVLQQAKEGSFFNAANRTVVEEEPLICVEEQILSRPHFQVKSVTQLERIFMVDVSQKGMFRVQLELILHFVNESRNPGTLPKIKKFFFNVGTEETKRQKEFLADLEKAALVCSPYYRRMQKK